MLSLIKIRELIEDVEELRAAWSGLVSEALQQKTAEPLPILQF